jgi:transposase
MRYELTDHEWTAIKPMLPNKPRGVARVNDRRVLNGIHLIQHFRQAVMEIDFDHIDGAVPRLTGIARLNF